jgi:hypothetical protein
MSTPVEVVKVALPLGNHLSAKQVVVTCTAQSSVIKQCPDYANAPAVQAAVGEMDTIVGQLQTTDGKIDNLAAELSALKKARAQQIGTVRLKHDNVEAAINTRSNGDPQAVQAWVGKVKTRAKPTPVTADTTPPTGASFGAVKRNHGMVKARCTPEPSVEGYLFQTGSDPLHPETWPAPSFSHGHTFTLKNQTIGQIVCVRIAIVRRGSVQSQWTQVLQAVVR